MNKTELVAKVAEETGLSKTDSQKAVESILSATVEALAAGDKVSLVGFGTFSISERAARTGRNPQTGKAMKISASKNVKFKAGKALKDRVS